MAESLPHLSPSELARYSRHLSLENIGIEGQRRLAAARVLVIGAGGLGSPAALYLAAAGVGTLGLADFDRVEEHNLQRQLLHNNASVGETKVSSGARRLRETNPHIRVVEHPEGVTQANALALFGDYDVIVDGTDNFTSRYLNNDAAALEGKPLVFGSVFKFEGQVSVFDTAHGGPCYRCLFPNPPPAGSVPDCGEAGVLGALCGVVGSLQALEAIKLITRTGTPLRGCMLTFDALLQEFRKLAYTCDPACPICGEHPSISDLESVDYAAGCAPRSASASTAAGRPSGTPHVESDDYPLEVTVKEARRLMSAAGSRTLLVDVREPYELAICSIPGAEAIPMRAIPGSVPTLPRDRHLLMLCHTGIRSLHATHFLREQGFEKVSNITGGIEAWAVAFDPQMPRY